MDSHQLPPDDAFEDENPRECREDTSVSDVHRLVFQFLDGVISKGDFVRLEDFLSSDELARQEFVAICHEASLLQELNRPDSAEFVTAATADLKSHGVGQTERPAFDEVIAAEQNKYPPNFRIRLRAKPLLDHKLMFASAATILVATSALFFLTQKADQHDAEMADAGVSIAKRSGQTQILDSRPLAEVVANVVSDSEDCYWLVENVGVAIDGSLEAGQIIRLIRGKVRLEFTQSRVVAEMVAPSILQVDNAMAARIVLGKIRVRVPDGLSGFTLATPQRSVVDLGTEFAVGVDDLGSTDVVVYEGEVNLRNSDSNIENHELQSKPDRIQYLSIGEGARITENGTVRRISSIIEDSFGMFETSDQMKGFRETTCIESVSDDMKPPHVWNYYKIVPGGMHEDALAFVDRENHQWNGVDPKGMPGYLVGGDYVMTFNNDKNVETNKIRVRIRQPATVYLFFDQRMVRPEWLRRQFEDTGDVIGLDEGLHVFNDGAVHDVESKTGAGESIDNFFSILKCEVHEPGELVLGGAKALTVPPQMGNMYGIVAVPLSE